MPESSYRQSIPINSAKGIALLSLGIASIFLAVSIIEHDRKLISEENAAQKDRQEALTYVFNEQLSNQEAVNHLTFYGFGTSEASRYDDCYEVYGPKSGAERRINESQHIASIYRCLIR